MYRGREPAGSDMSMTTADKRKLKKHYILGMKIKKFHPNQKGCLFLEISTFVTKIKKYETDSK